MTPEAGKTGNALEIDTLIDFCYLDKATRALRKAIPKTSKTNNRKSVPQAYPWSAMFRRRGRHLTNSEKKRTPKND